MNVALTESSLYLSHESSLNVSSTHLFLPKHHQINLLLLSVLQALKNLDLPNIINCIRALHKSSFLKSLLDKSFLKGLIYKQKQRQTHPKSPSLRC